MHQLAMTHWESICNYSRCCWWLRIRDVPTNVCPRDPRLFGKKVGGALFGTTHPIKLHINYRSSCIRCGIMRIGSSCCPPWPGLPLTITGYTPSACQSTKIIVAASMLTLPATAAGAPAAPQPPTATNDTDIALAILAICHLHHKQ